MSSIMLTSCLTTRTTVTTIDTSCQAFKELSYLCKDPLFNENGELIQCSEDSDTVKTVKEIRGHNAGYRSICP